jgi:Pyruvate/2-oxoacid:ferredoxin oxidoreductase delta subunit
MSLLDEFLIEFGVWDVAQPYIHMIVDELEMRLIVDMKGQALSVHEVAARLGMALGKASAFLDRCYSRGLVNKTVDNGETQYEPSDFYGRLNYYAMFDNWDDIPESDRKVIDRRFLDEAIARYRPNVERKMQGLTAENALPNDAVMLLHEIEAMFDAAEHFVLLPCDCRRLGQYCDRPVEVCIALDQRALDMLDRGHGRRIGRDEAKELVRWADKKGLMHTADAEWRTRGMDGMCNCCECDCYPFRAALALGSKGVWPKSRYVAVHDRSGCNLCGSCVKRCHFDAFFHDGTFVEVDGKTKQNVDYDPDKCWGCGLCVNTCPSDAIVMEALM